jgi:hypothetical protein
MARHRILPSVLCAVLLTYSSSPFPLEHRASSSMFYIALKNDIIIVGVVAFYKVLMVSEAAFAMVTIQGFR